MARQRLENEGGGLAKVGYYNTLEAIAKVGYYNTLEAIAKMGNTKAKVPTTK
ncbi:unnamed protein product [marine sediment metagenome]|uniref:Uncharacterized protein n=1 Tax=marine sediment metagenome TaxID=412755 RepID=X1VMW6_9ZZZZ